MATFTSLETLTTAYSTTTCTLNDMEEDCYALTTSIISTMSSLGRFPHVNITIADRYIDSLSDTQLAELDQRLTEKDNEAIVIDGNTYTFNQAANETPEVEKVKVNRKV